MDKKEEEKPKKNNLKAFLKKRATNAIITAKFPYLIESEKGQGKTLKTKSNNNLLGLDKPPSETKVVVAMSGGVDSSVVAGLMKMNGYQVIGMTLQLYDYAQINKKPGNCCAGQDKIECGLHV